MTGFALRDRGIRTWAWLGDALFELEVRRRVVARGDHPPEVLDTVRARVVRAETQAELLAAIEPHLDEVEAAVVQRGRNARVLRSARARRDVRSYRAATALEALVAHWTLCGPEDRMQGLLGPFLEATIDGAMELARRKPRRG